MDKSNAIDVSTLCRCTGLTDRKNSLIFENDLCGCPSCGAVGYVKDNNIIWLNGEIVKENASQPLTTYCNELEVLDSMIDHPEI